MHTSIFHNFFRFPIFHGGVFHGPHWFTFVAAAGFLLFAGAVITITILLLQKTR